MDKKLIFAIFLVLTLFNTYGFVRCSSYEEDNVVKQGLIDLRRSFLENTRNSAINDIAQCQNKINDLEKENAQTKMLVYLMADLTQTREVLNAYENGHCYNSRSSDGYNNKLATTVHDKTCQRWDQQYPHEHSYTNVTTFPDGSLSDAANYCRDPSNSGYTWCYTTDPNVRWEPCDVTGCMTEYSPDICRHFDEESTDYTGHLSTTFDGHSCQKWSSQYPHSHNYTSSQFPEGDIYEAGNYCRDPGHWGLLWCYTNDPNTRWEVCDIAKCYEQNS